jgi:hypothetical protein
MTYTGRFDGRKRKAEQARLGVEQAHVQAERARLEAEQARLRAEHARIDAEQALLQAEQARRQVNLSEADKQLKALVAQLKSEAPPGRFQTMKNELYILKEAYQRLSLQEKRELDELHANAHARQLRKFLESCFIDSADIPGIGPGRKATLRSYGIETAADVNSSRVEQVCGFGESRTRVMLDWRANCERRFRFNPATAVTEADRNAVRAKFVHRRLALQAQLQQGANELRAFRDAAAAKLATLQPVVQNAARKVEQCRLDLTLVK